MTRKTRMSRGLSWLVMAALGTAALTACGDGGVKAERSGEDEFESRLQSIVQEASSQYGELAEQAGALSARKPLPDAFKEEMLAFAAIAERAADEIVALNPPQGAEDLIEMLVEALRARATAFEEAAGRARVTLHQLEQDGSITDTGERIDSVLQRLRKAGVLPEEESHQ